jgi:ABC-type branched-subunit amino acid transport system ATPase component
MNLPSEAVAQRNFLDSCEKETTSRLSALESEKMSQSIGQGEAPYVDRLPIRMFELQHRFEDVVALSSVSLELKQGLLHGIAGSRRSGKSTVLRLIGGRAVPNPDAPPNSLYIPQHLRTLHVSKDPLFFHGTLYENLVYGVTAGDDKDGKLERVLNICKSLNVAPSSLALISTEKDAKVANWSEVLPASDQHLLNIVRALICNPEVVCVHQPSLGVGVETQAMLFKSLKVFVLQRGLFQDLNRYYFRRPRTCIISTMTENDLRYVDEVHYPFSDTHRPSSVVVIKPAGAFAGGSTTLC